MRPSDGLVEEEKNKQTCKQTYSKQGNLPVESKNRRYGREGKFSAVDLVGEKIKLTKDVGREFFR